MNIIILEMLSRAFLQALAGMVVRSTCFALLCALLLFLLRVRKPAARHFLWSGALYGPLSLPLLQIAALQFRTAAPVLPQPRIASLSAAPTVAQITHKPASSAFKVKPIPQPFPWAFLATSLHLAVSSLLLAQLAFSLIRVGRIVARSEPILDVDLRRLYHDVWLESLAPYRPRVRISRDVTIPLAVGTYDPSILLPVSWSKWPTEKLRAVLIHEMAHIRREDASTMVLASLAICFFWLHPLAYWMRRHLHASAEEACDDAVIESVDRRRYSQILIEFASDVQQTRGRLLALPSVAAPRSQIENRLERIFAPRIPSRSGARFVKAMAVGVLCPALYLTAGAHFQTEQASVASGQYIVIQTAEEANGLEAALQRNPDDLIARSALMMFYANTRNENTLAPHALWFVKNHPESWIVLPSETNSQLRQEFAAA